MKCMICGEKGEVTQCPYRLPLSLCLCDDCYALEGHAFDAWMELFRYRGKHNAPIPFNKSSEDFPEYRTGITREEIKEFYKNRFREEEKR